MSQISRSIPSFYALLIRIIFITLFRSTSALSASTLCYEPDGTLNSADTACNDGATASTCCAEGWSCLSDGVCTITEEVQGINDTFYYRGTCTDQSWNDPGCLNICRDGSTGITGTSDNISLALIKCIRSDNQDYYCCSNDPNCDCRNQEGAVYSLGSVQPFTQTVIGSSTWANEVSSTAPTSTAKITAPNPITYSTKPTSSSEATTATTGSGSTAVATSSSTGSGVSATITPLSASTKSTSHVGLGVGLGVGIGAGLVIIAIVVFLLIRARRESKRSNVKLDQTYGKVVTELPAELENARYEADGEVRWGRDRPAEMP